MRRIIALLVLLVLLAVPVAAHTNHVSADTQVSADGRLIIEAIYPADDVWLAVHLDDDGSPGTVIGYRRVAGGTFHMDVPVVIENNTWENWTGSRQLHVVLHQTNGDGQFDPEADEPISSFGSPVTDQLLEKGPTARVTAESFGPEKASENAITLRSVVLPDDGHVVLRNSSADGAIVGHASLDAGTHDAVRVNFNNSFSHAQDEQFQLFASIVLDDGDGESEADDDRLAVETEPVGTVISVQRTNPDGHDHEHDHESETTTSERTGTNSNGTDSDGHDHEHEPETTASSESSSADATSNTGRTIPDLQQ